MEAWLAEHGREWMILGRVALAMLFGGVLGLEREMAGKAAGLRTHMLMAGAAALVVGVADVVAERIAARVEGGTHTTTDPLRVIEAVVAAVGFIGAGAIMRGRDQKDVEGLTTAAALLMTAAIGICVASDMLLGAIGTTILVLITLRAILWWEPR